jgi:transketolase
MHNQLQEISNYTKYLAACTINKANSGHTGAAIGMADFLTVLYAKHLNFDRQNTKAINRDRFVMSNGHASALLYSLLHIAGFEDASLQELQNFRQLNSKTAGHPELGELEGIDISTGPLGQGIANAVGMALASKKLDTQSKVYVSVGDGCLSEGISHEAFDLAGHLKLDNLIVMFDNNNITIDGPTSLYTSTNIKKRMQAYGFNVLECDGHSIKKIDKTLTKAKKQTKKPTFIIFNTIIGKDTAYANTNKVHGLALNNDDLAKLKESLNIHASDFTIPTKIYNMFSEIHKNKKFVANKIEIEDNSKNLQAALTELKKLAIEENVSQATRASMGECIEMTARLSSNFISGSADLTPSNCTKSNSMEDIISSNFAGDYIHYGIKEHAMAAIANGICVFTNKEYTLAVGTFLAFADYLKPAARMSAIMGLPIQYILTHDSIGVGEDGPTHQPIEQLTMLRAMPNSYTFRPCDMVETIEAWQTALEIKNAPSFHILSRQNLSLVRTSFDVYNKTASGGYVIYENENKKTDKLDAIIIASGSEVAIAIQTAKMLEDEGDNVKVVSIPCLELFRQQSDKYKEIILPKSVENRLVIEAGSSMGLAELVGLNGKTLCLDTFGKSAKADDIYEYFNLNAKFAYNEIKSMI